MTPFAKNEKRDKENVNEKRISNTHRHSIHTFMLLFRYIRSLLLLVFVAIVEAHMCEEANSRYH